MDAMSEQTVSGYAWSGTNAEPIGRKLRGNMPRKHTLAGYAVRQTLALSNIRIRVFLRHTSVYEKKDDVIPREATTYPGCDGRFPGYRGLDDL